MSWKPKCPVALIGVICCLLAAGHHAAAQTTVLFEGFEGAFPGALWSVGDSNPTTGSVFWDDVNSVFGGEGVHSGGWKGYCAGIGFAGSTVSPFYTNNMTAFMSRSVDLSGFTQATLHFWHKVPSIEVGFDYCRVYVDSNLIWSNSAAITSWTLVNLDLDAFTGVAHTLRFEFFSDITVTGEGWYLDDIEVTAANSALAESIEGMSVTNYTGYVIDSDASNPAPEYDRESILAQTVVRTENFTGLITLNSYVLTYRLLDATTGLPHPIYDSTGQTNATYTYNVTNSTFMGAYAVVFDTNVGSIKPAARLNPYTQYTVEARVFRGGVFTGDQATDGPRTYYHFTNLVSADAAFNVISTLNSSAYTRTYLVNTVPGEDSITVNADYTLLRYDGFSAAPAANNITVHLNLQLVDVAANTNVPLTSSSTTFTKSVQSHGIIGNPIPPTVVNYVDPLNLKPATGQQLDSVNKLYKVIVSIDHVDVIAQPPVAGNSLTLADQRMLHFNGHLFFGGIDTLFTSIANVPAPGIVSPPTFVTSFLAVDANSGFVVGKPAHTYGSGFPLPVNLGPNGDATFTGGFPVLLTTPVPDIDAINNVRFERLPGTTTLSTAGARSDIRLILPTGFGYRADTASRILTSTIDFPGVPLTQALAPAGDLTFAPAPPIFACEETKPFWIETAAMNWLINQGQIMLAPTGVLKYVRKDELDSLESFAPALVEPDMAIKRSNEQYFRFVDSLTTPDVMVKADANGAALLSINLKFQPTGGFRTHFPYDARTAWAGAGEMKVSDDLVVAGSSFLNTVSPVAMDYARNCTDLSCPGTIGPATLTLNLNGDQLQFTRDGGLIGAGNFTAPEDLQWGNIPPPAAPNTYAHESFDYQDANYLMAGCFLGGGQTALDEINGASVILFSGVAETNLNYLERPVTLPYLDGFADYAGLNFRVLVNSNHFGHSTLAGKSVGPYPLTGRSKYYARRAGVSGIHEAVFGSFPPTATLYGCKVNFSNFGLAFLDSQNVDSRTQGDITIPYPSDFVQEFEELRFTCLGALDSAKVPASSGDKVLDYWNADFKTLAIKFESPSGCDPSAGFLFLGVEAYASHVDQPLYGRLGFRSNGNLITQTYAVSQGLPAYLNSRLKPPNKIKLKGPATENYAFTPVTDAYYNNFANMPTPEGGSPKGFINLAGKLDVTFFEDLQVHIQTSAQRSNNIAPIHMFGGWEDPPGQNFFNTSPFDEDNKGFDGVNINAYRNAPSPQYRVHARQDWLGVVNFDYPLDWNTTTRSFKSSEQVTDTLLVVDVKHQVDYLSAQHAEISFGIEYDGLPQVNIANLAFNAIDEQIGVIHAFADAGLGAIRGEIEEGLDRLTDMLNAQMHAFMSGVFDQLIDPGVDVLYGQLSGAFPGGTLPLNWQVTAADIVYSNIVTGVGTPIKQRLKDVIGATTNAVGVLNQLNSYLGEAEQAVSQAQQLLAPDGSGARQKINDLTKELVGELGSQFISLATHDAINALLEKVAPQLNQVTNTLGDLHGVITNLQSRLGAAGDFATELQTKVSSLSGSFDSMALQIRSDITNALLQLDTPSGNFLAQYSAAEIKAKIRQKIEDRFFASDVASSIQEIIKQRVYDADAAIREAMDSAFQQVNTVMRDLVSESLAELDNTINKMVGDFSDVMGAGRIDGYAHITGDSLTLLRLDGHFEWKVPDEMEFNAYLQIKELDSDGPPSCSVTSGKAAEVTVGATDVSVDWISPDLRANIGGKFSFQTTPSFRPIGMGGSFELTGGLKFEAFEITELGATMAFGQLENYLGCKARVKFNKYEFAGGLFFGKTCTIEPLLLVDPDVAGVLGPPPFTGAYVYAEGWIPLNEAIGIPSSCFFNIRAGVGAGAFYFVEGPTFGGKALLGLSGEVLCIVSVKGEVKMIGVKQGDDLTLKGIGTLSGEIGACPFCIDFSKSIGMKYKNGSFDVDF
jgi:hypothetical protein